jgi:hypothetical protein
MTFSDWVMLIARVALAVLLLQASGLYYRFVGGGYGPKEWGRTTRLLVGSPAIIGFIVLVFSVTGWTSGCTRSWIEALTPGVLIVVISYLCRVGEIGILYTIPPLRAPLTRYGRLLLTISDNVGPMWAVGFRIVPHFVLACALCALIMEYVLDMRVNDVSVLILLMPLIATYAYRYVVVEDVFGGVFSHYVDVSRGELSLGNIIGCASLVLYGAHDGLLYAVPLSC